MLILGIETSCDETACAVVEDGTEVYSNIIASQVELHSPFGGVVPELSARAHIQRIILVADEAIKQAGISSNDIDAISVTLGPGLIGALLVGVEFGKSLAFTWKKPLIPTNHIAGHLYAPFLKIGRAKTRTENIKPDGMFALGHLSKPLFEAPPLQTAFTSSSQNTPHYPYLGLVVSGGHTYLILTRGPMNYEIIGETMDDAAGEAYDKVAKLLHLGYPGGPIIDKLAEGGDPDKIRFPRPLIKSDELNFSFSGLKTAVMKYIKDQGLDNVLKCERWVRDISASFQSAVIESLLDKTGKALQRFNLSQLAIVGGVACNSGLRKEATARFGLENTFIPPPILCADNAAMTAGLAFHFKEKFPSANLNINAQANLPLNFLEN